MTRSGGGVVLARRESMVVPLDVLVNWGLPPVCAVSGLPAEETLTTRVVGRRTPLWLLLFGIVPYLVVRLLLGSGGTGIRVELPVTKAVADRLALARTAVVLAVAVVVGLGSVFALVPLGVAAFIPLALALVVLAVAGITCSAIAVTPRLCGELVTLSVSHQLREIATRRGTLTDPVRS